MPSFFCYMMWPTSPSFRMCSFTNQGLEILTRTKSWEKKIADDFAIFVISLWHIFRVQLLKKGSSFYYSFHRLGYIFSCIICFLNICFESKFNGKLLWIFCLLCVKSFSKTAHPSVLLLVLESKSLYNFVN